MSDLFRWVQEVQLVKSLKRAKSIRLELLVVMPNAGEANVFWIDTKLKSGMLLKVGRSGGIAKLVEIRLDIEAMCSG